MNNQHFKNYINPQEHHQDYTFTSPELDRDFGNIINIAVKSLKASISLIAFVHDNSLFVRTNHKILDGKTINFKGTIFEKSLSQQTIGLQNISVNEIGKEVKTYASSPIRSKGGKTIGFLAIIDHNSRIFSSEELSLLEDLTKITSEIFEKHNTVQKLHEVFTDFVHKTIHDLKNPLTSISLTTELIKRKADNAKLVMGFSEHLENSTNKTFKSLEQLKADFPIKNSFKLNIKEIDINDLLLTAKQQTNHKITIDNQLAHKIYGDYDRLAEAIAYLINHVLLLSEAQKNITLKSYEKENQAVIEISNSSSEVFFREAHEIRSSTALAISKKLIEMHRGKITAACHEESESYLFYISLPLETL